MAKKTFKDNPALQFISSKGAEEESSSMEVNVTKLEQETGTITVTPKKVKQETDRKPPKGYKLNPLYVEVKSKRVQLVLQPSLFDRVKERAKEQGLSVNEYVHRILDRETREE